MEMVGRDRVASALKYWPGGRGECGAGLQQARPRGAKGKRKPSNLEAPCEKKEAAHTSQKLWVRRLPSLLTLLASPARRSRAARGRRSPGPILVAALAATLSHWPRIARPRRPATFTVRRHRQACGP